MKNLLYIFLFFSINCFAQRKFNPVKTIDIEADFFTTDDQGNIYAVKSNELIKYDKTGKELYKYSNKNLGAITFVDASNMLKILVFYKDFLQVVFLDNTLSLQGEPLSFDKIGFQQVQLVCNSFNNGMWIYNQQNFSLVQLNPSYEIAQQTVNLNAILNIDLQPDFMMEHDNRLFMNNPSTGILIFDIYGTYHKTIPVKNVKQFQPVGEWVYYADSGKVKAYNITSTEEKQFEMPLSDFLNFRVELGFLMVQTAKGISIYSAE